MFRPSPRRATIVFLLALVFAGPWSAAEAAGGARTPWLQPWDLAAQLWEAFAGLWADNGCSVDPSGRCGAGSQAENGCSLDPNGRCARSQEGSTAEEGCSVDPDGRRLCRPAGATAAYSDEGCSLDPSGGCRK